MANVNNRFPSKPRPPRNGVIERWQMLMQRDQTYYLLGKDGPLEIIVTPHDSFKPPRHGEEMRPAECLFEDDVFVGILSIQCDADAPGVFTPIELVREKS